MLFWGVGGGSHEEDWRLPLPSLQYLCRQEGDSQRSEPGNKGFVPHGTSETDELGSIMCGHS